MAVLLTLICPVYRVREFIPDLLDSLLRGVNSPEVRLIFINDGTPDESMDLLRARLAASEGQRRFEFDCIDQPVNRGLSASRNLGLDLADSPYIGMIDSDDIVDSQYFSVLRPYLLDGRNDLVEFGYAEFTDAAAWPGAGTGRELPSSQLNPYLHDFFSWTRVYKAELLRGLRYPVDAVYEDVRFVAEVFGRVRCSVRLSHALVGYRKRADSITEVRKRDRRYAEQMIHLVDGTALALAGHAWPGQVLALTARRACIILLKGARIVDVQERRAFFQACRPPLGRLQALCRAQQGSWRAAPWLALARAGLLAQRPFGLA